MTAAGSVLAAAGIALSAYAAHVRDGEVRARLQMAAVFAFGHGVALAALAPHAVRTLARIALAAMLLGVLCFSGSLAAAHFLGTPTSLVAFRWQPADSCVAGVRGRCAEALSAMPRYSRGFDTDAAAAHLAQARSQARRLDEAASARSTPDPRWRKPFDPVDALARAILYQQLSGKAAATIVGRVEAAIGSDRFHCDTLARCDDADTARLRRVRQQGCWRCATWPRAKRAARFPTCGGCRTMTDDAIIDALMPVRGIGRWTVEMMLMFRLGRPDVLPVDDLGVRKGAQVLDKLDAMPTPKELVERRRTLGTVPHATPACTCGASPIRREGEAPTKRSQD